MEEANKYLKEGELTQITPQVKKVVNQIPEEDRKFIEGLFNWVKEGGYFRKLPEKEERKLLDAEHLQRTVNQILESHYAIACGEKTMVFIALCRAKGIPAKYVEAVGLDFLRAKTDEHVHTHAFAEVYLQGRWWLVNPDAMKIYNKIDYEKYGYIKWVEGTDTRDLTDKEGRHYSWRNFNEFIRDALAFKRR
ncbi:MAG: transglutaminase-like domain-containing protein [Patescibacteria group bacterium]